MPQNGVRAHVGVSHFIGKGGVLYNFGSLRKDFYYNFEVLKRKKCTNNLAN